MSKKKKAKIKKSKTENETKKTKTEYFQLISMNSLCANMVEKLVN